MAKVKSKNKRLEIPFFDGVNALVSSSISKKQELSRAENARSEKIGSIEKRKGIRRLGSEITTITDGNYGLFYFENSTTKGMYRVSRVGASTDIYYQANDGTWTLVTGSINLGIGNVSTTVAEDCCFIVNGTKANRYITSTGTTFLNSAHIPSHLVQSPLAYLINYYKDKLYLGDYTIGSTRYKTGILRSSVPLGVVTLVDGDHASPVTSLNVTDAKYIYVTGTTEYDILQIYRGNTLITGTTDADITSQFDVTNPSGDTFRYTWDTTGQNPNIATYLSIGSSVTLAGFNAANNGTFILTEQGGSFFEVTNASGVVESNITSVTITVNSITVTAKTDKILTIKSFKAAINSSDELWARDTYSGSKLFRWVNNAPSGDVVKEYDTLKLAGDQTSALTMMTNVGNVMMIANKHNMAAWNDYTLQNFDSGMGCVSRRGWVKSLGSLWFVHYSGIYTTSGGTPQLMSAKVERYIKGATKAGLEASAAGRRGLSVFFAVGAVTLYNDDGSTEATLDDVVLEYNIRQENWYPHTGIEATQFTTYIATDDPDRLEFSSSTSPAHIYELFNTEEDNDTDIPFRIDTDNITLCRFFENIAEPLEVIVEVERGSGLKLFVSLDDGPFYQLRGDLNKGCNILKIHGRTDDISTPPRCRLIKFSIRDYTPKICKISRMAISFTETSEEEEFRSFEK